MIEHMPGHNDGVDLPAGEGVFGAQEGYVDRGPRREPDDTHSAHGPWHSDGVDTRYDKPHPNSLIGRARKASDRKTLERIAAGRAGEGM